MSTLHLVNRAPPASDALAACAAVLRPGDGILLIEDGVHASTLPDLHPVPDVEYLVLAADAEARGCAQRRTEHWCAIDRAAFVEACVRHDRVVSWS